MANAPMSAEEFGLRKGVNLLSDGKGRYMKFRFMSKRETGEKRIHSLFRPFFERIFPKPFQLIYYPLLRESTDDVLFSMSVVVPDSEQVYAEKEAEILSQLKAWHGQGQIGDADYGLGDESNKFPAHYGGAQARVIREATDDLSSRLLLGFVDAHGWDAISNNQNAFAADLALSIYRIGATSLSLTAKEASSLLRRRAIDLGRGISASELEAFGTKYSQAIAQQVRKQQENHAWRDALGAFNGKLKAVFRDHARHRKEIEGQMTLHDWLGRALIHYSCARFYLGSLKEALLLSAVSEALREELLPWNPDVI